MNHRVEKRIALVLLVIAVAATTEPVQGASTGESAGDQPVIVRVTDSGFHWADAALGVAGAVAIGLLVFGVVLALRTNQSKQYTHRGRS